ncbi:hypothetical protein [Streptomyces sp. NPDC060035]|uniref:hypothetical protein n=1 Tax=Streptomyces sp. NPDC060035 TaxID=3347044 RepID=UPI0036AA20AD
MMHRTGPTDSSADEEPRTAAEARQAEATHTEAPRTTPGPGHAAAPGTAPEPRTASKARPITARTDGTRTTTPGPDGKQVINRGPGDTNVPPAPRPAPAAAPAGRPTDRPEVTPAGLPLLPVEEQDTLTRRMQQAVSDFVESPRQAVEEAESTFDRIVADLTEALEERRHVLRSSWQAQDTEARTEELRVALQQYRDVGERLLRI